MKLKVISILFFLGCFSLFPQEIIQIESYDGTIIKGRLNLPSDNYLNKIVIDVPGTGPNTYLNKRKIGSSLIFNYHDYFSDEFNKRGIAYFSYNTRYTEMDTLPPYYDKVNKDSFYTYTPMVKIKDLESIIKFLRNDPRLKSSKFILLGESEGTINASIVAERNNVPVDALLLVGTPAENVYKTIEWQLSGASSMINYRKFFDKNDDGIIQKEEYVNGDPRAKYRVGGLEFDQLDLNEDSVLTKEDFNIMLKDHREKIFTAVENGDDDWIWNNFFRIGTEWVKEHKELEPNKKRLLKLDIPVYIFHGEDDANTPVEGVEEIRDKAAEQNKNNIHVFTFPEHDHSLEFLGWVIRKEMPEGLKTLFEKAVEI